MGVIGQHLLADLHGVCANKLNGTALLRCCLEQAAHKCKLTPVAAPVMHEFPGGGVTGFILLSESHISLHTYPELNYVAVDILSCGESHPSLALEVFRNALLPTSEWVQTMARGNNT